MEIIFIARDTSSIFALVVLIYDPRITSYFVTLDWPIIYISLMCILISLPFQFVFLVINMLAVVLCQYAGRLSPANMLAISLSYSFSYVQLIENG